MGLKNKDYLISTALSFFCLLFTAYLLLTFGFMINKLYTDREFFNPFLIK